MKKTLSFLSIGCMLLSSVNFPVVVNAISNNDELLVPQVDTLPTEEVASETVNTYESEQSEEVEGNQEVENDTRETIMTWDLNDITVFVNSPDPIRTEQMFNAAYTKEGISIPFEDLTITGLDMIDLSKYGVFQIGFSYLDSDIAYATLTVSEAANLVTVDSYSGYRSKAIDRSELIVQCVTVLGAVDFSTVKIDSDLNLNNPQEGVYEVKFTYQDASSSTTVIIEENQSQLELVADSVELIMGVDTFNAVIARSYIALVTDYDGTTIDASQVTINTSNINAVNMNQAGTYRVSYWWNGITRYLDFIVKASDSISIQTKDIEIGTEDAWEPEDSFISGTNENGDVLLFESLSVVHNVNRYVPGEYTVDFSYKGYTASAKVEVIAGDGAGIFVKHTEIYENDPFDPESMFVYAIDDEDHIIEYDDINITYDEEAILNVGTHEIIFEYGNLRKIALLTVLKDQTQIILRNDKISAYVGRYTAPYNELQTIILKDGTQLSNYTFILNASRYEGSVTYPSGYGITSGPFYPSQHGTVDIIYKIRNVEAVVTLTILQNHLDVQSRNSTLYIGDTWTSADNFVSASDLNGNSLNVNEISKIDGTVPTDEEGRVNQIGSFQVTYWMFGAGNSQASKDTKSSTAIINVLESFATLSTISSSLIYGSSWTPADNYVGGLTFDGQPLSFNEVTVSGEVDTNKAGVYEITYSYRTISQTVTVTVVAFPVRIYTANSSIYQGNTWDPEDSFILALNQSAQSIPFEAITVEGTVDTETIGTYHVSYSYMDVESEAQIEVVERLTGILARDLELIINTPWAPEDHFVDGTKMDGSSLLFSDVTTTIINSETGERVEHVDVTRAGSYQVAFEYEEITEIARLTIFDYSSLLVHKQVVLMIGDFWDSEQGFISATTPSGEILDFSSGEVLVDGSEAVDTSVVGLYVVTYKYLNHEEKVNVIVEGTLSLDISSDAHFGSVILGTEDMILPWKGSIIVSDTRYQSNGWSLSGKIVDATDYFSNYIYYNDSLLENNSLIATSHSGGTTNITEDWSKERGIRIDYSSTNQTRVDSATIQWTLSSTITEELEE